MFYTFRTILQRDLLIAFRHRIDLLSPLFFFMIVVTLFPLAISAEPQKLIIIGPGAIWIAMTFASMLSLDNLFIEDFEDGTLEQLLLHSNAFPITVLAKLIAQWLTTAFPLVIASLLLGKLYFLPNYSLLMLAISLLLGSPVLFFIGAIGSALTLGLKNRGILLVLMVLPLYLPVVIFGSSVANNAISNLPIASALLFLAALLSLSITFIPVTAAAALRISLE